MTVLTFFLTVGAGLIAGFINTLAGSGSAVSVTLLKSMGLETGVVNATNRVAILLQNIVGVGNFHRKGLLEKKKSPWLIAPAALGGILGAFVAVKTRDRWLDVIIGMTMMAALALLIFQPKRFLHERPEKLDRRPGLGEMLGYFAIGFYGGMVQIAVGVFLLMELVLVSGYDLLKANAVKLAIVLVYTIPVVCIFAAKGLIRWDIGLVLALGNMLGAWIASHTAARRGAGFVRWLLIVMVSYAAGKFLGLWPLLNDLITGGGN